MDLIRFACPSCGRHILSTHDQIGAMSRCSNCNAAATVPKTSTLPSPSPEPRVRFGCPSCGQHISATRAQIGVTAPCPNCKTAVTVPKTSTLPSPAPEPLKTKFPGKKRYESTVILIDDNEVPTTSRKLKKWTDNPAEAQNWLTRHLGAFHGARYFAAIFDHKEKKSLFKKRRDKNRS